MSGVKERIRDILGKAGALAVGFSRADAVEAGAWEFYTNWIDKGRNAEMDYMTNYPDIRRDPRLLLEGANTVISLAFGYRNHAAQKERASTGLPLIASYALIADYHNSLRKLIRRSGVGELLGEEGRDWRICIDSAPIMERYWAVMSGIGFRGRNGMVIVPGYGSEVFLAEIVTKQIFQPDACSSEDCGACGACLKICPTGALQPDGTIDCDRCLSYLTIEHRGEWKSDTHMQAVGTPEGRNTLFGCDRCIAACPHNSKYGRTADKHTLLPGIVSLGIQEILQLQEEELRIRLKGSSLKRAGIEGLRRNARNIKNP